MLNLCLCITSIIMVAVSNFKHITSGLHVRGSKVMCYTRRLVKTFKVKHNHKEFALYDRL